MGVFRCDCNTCKTNRMEKSIGEDIGTPLPIPDNATNSDMGVVDQSKSTRKLKKMYQCVGCGKILSSYQSLWRHKKKTCKKVDNAINPPDAAGELTTPFMELESLLLEHARVYWENVEKGRMVDEILRKGCIPERALPREFINARVLWLSEHQY